MDFGSFSNKLQCKLYKTIKTFKLMYDKGLSFYKKYDKKLINNYRPISVLPVRSKVFEIVIFDQLTEHFTNNNLFSSQQCGFRKN